VTTIHFVFLAITLLGPVGLCVVSRRLKSGRFDRGVERSIAGMLFAIAIGQIVFKLAIERAPLAAALPMHLCDWALFATAVALWWRAPRCFELAYFWGLAGTVQGLITPDLDPTLAVWRQVAFFVIHAGIVVGVLFLVFATGMRPTPASLLRVLWWSELYLISALTVNALTGYNYGFLSHPPATPSLLDRFPTEPWLYVAMFNAVALVAFALLYLPWWIVDLRRESSAPRKTRRENFV
jgi:hypothetical integral membrane protein (TIGR02206 family)